VKSKNKEELQCVQTLLDDSNKTCEELRNKLQEASVAEETMKKQLSEQQTLYVKEIEKLKKALGIVLKITS
jgi:antitoxin component HigA of HigAB toxin-antitoxin module